ncbi:Enamine deaminase RidA, house cleaning of reactive enamine intermediates, YjgF/YER057c/UK114 family [Sulfitobacter brevis]|uniref:Enamine deaminase RidA, house cleaning of reactive enamine intermediates, YjgF/YER057c/UK114 family n=1 Tax=Sulfitobacter brevis TaxID=74348 RepID=A0A1I1UEA2_9RHOB|nr:RidA family protein [Sulfitobacter brevis]SFD69079.1 Enamine deaminase RidA, house cleaning of reactive enamine intermediates, YjgF/YER057c/UK114 family [Sulfitobacter brevis]
MSTIERHHGGPRMSQIVVHGETVYLAGQVGTEGASVAQQTQDCLDKVDALLAEVGSDKSRMLQVIIWLADMADFAEMNGVWDAWVPQGNTPVRACGEAKLATPGYTVEVIVTAAK